jgi:Tol biopolymer transport system component
MIRNWKVIAAMALSLLLFGCKLTTEPVVQEKGLDVLPSWSTDGSTISFTAVYNGVQGIYLIDTAGTTLRLLIAGTVGGSSWSPDSKWLAFAGPDGIYKVKANGDSAALLTSSPYDYHPAWSPDGNKIAFVRYSYGVMVYDLRTELESTAFGSGYSPSWHPNGDLIVFSGTSPGGSQGNSYTFYAVQDSANWRPLSSFVTSSTCTYSSASPKGTGVGTIAFSLKSTNEYTQVWTQTVATGARIQVTVDGGDGASWSPDGSRIVYTRTIPGDGGLWIMNADGSGKHRLTNPSHS